MMKKIFALVFILVLGKMSYSQTYPLQQNLGSDSTIVISKGALQSRLAPIVISDTTAANNQRIKNYPGAQLYTANGDFYVRNATATKWVLVSSGSSGPINIYNSDGTLTGNRVLTGAGNSLTFSGISGLGINKVADSVFTVEGGIHATGGLRLENLASSPGTKALRINSQGVVSVADTTISGGTVTQINTNNATGITGGPITTSGTLAIDTTLISTRAWRQKGIDSVANLPRVTSVGLTMPVAFNVAGSPVTNSGTLAVTAAGLSTQYIRGDGQLANFPGGGGGGGSSVVYYFNGGTNQGTFVGNTYYEMSKTAIVGTAANFTINADGYITQFITDAGDPALLNIPAGNWNFEMYFNASSGGGSPSFYVELYKYDGTTFTLISSSSSAPEGITGGTATDLYLTALAVPATSLTLTDRLAVRVYVTHSGRTITLHTQDNTLCQVTTTFTTGITALNGLTDQVQYFATGTSGTDFSISSASATHTFNLPTASATNRGALSSSDWTTFNSKISPSDTASMLAPYLRKADTTAMLANYVNNVGYGLSKAGQVVSADSATLANYFLRRKDSLTSTNLLGYVTRTILADTAAAIRSADAGGTVTSIATNNGTGITGGTITTTGTLAIDTLLISTRAWRQKGVDSVAALVNSNVSGTTNRVSKFTGANTIGNSSIADSSSSVAMTILSNGNIGINTTAPNERLEIVGTSRFTRTTSPSVYLNISMENGFAEYDARGSIDHVWENGGVENMRLALGGNLGIGTASPDSMLTVLEGARFQRGVRMSGLPSAPGTRALRIDANGTLSVADTTTGGGGIGGSGTTNYLPKFTASTTLGDSRFFDNGTVTFLGNGDVNATPSTGIFSGTGGTGTNIAGAELRIRGGASTGSAAGGPITFYTSAAGTAGTGVNAATEVARFDTRGNLGMNTTPQSWGTSYRAIQIGQRGGLWAHTSAGSTYLSENIWDDGSASKYIVTGAAAGYQMASGAHYWYQAASGTAGTNISLTTSMFLNTSNNLGIGTTTIGSRLQVNGNAAIGYSASTAAPTNGLAVSGSLGVGVTSTTWKAEIFGGNANTLKLNNDNSQYVQLMFERNSVANSGGDILLDGTNATFSMRALATHALVLATSATAGAVTERFRINNTGSVFIGNGETNASPSTGIISGTGGTGTNIAGAEFRIRGGASTGSGAGGPITFYTSAAGTAGTTTNAATERMRLSTSLQVGSSTTSVNTVMFINSSATTANTFNSTLALVNKNATSGALNGIMFSNSGEFGSAAIYTTQTNTTNNGDNIVLTTKQSNGSGIWNTGVIINTSGSLGVGTSTIGSALQVNGGAAIGYSASTAAPTNGLAVSGNVGINTTTIGSRLQVNGNAAIGYSASTAAPTNGLLVAGISRFAYKTAGATESSLIIGDDIAASTNTGRSKVTIGNTSAVSELLVGQSSTNALLFNWTYNATPANAYGVLETYGGNNNIVLQSSGGNIGITTTTIGSKLQINGNLAVGYSASTAAPTNGLSISGNTTIGTTTAAGKFTIDPDDNQVGLAITGTSLTSSNAQSLIDLAQTWNTTGNPTAIKLNITNTASGASADLMELQVGGVNQFVVTKAGVVGIGATSPSNGRLHIDPSDNETALIVNGTSVTGSSSTNLIDLSQTWNTTGTPTAIKLNVTNTASGASSYLMDLQLGSSNRFRVLKGGTTYVSDGTVEVYLDPITSFGVGVVGTSSNHGLSFAANGGIYATLQTTGEFWVNNNTDQGAYNLQVGGTGVWGAGAYVNGSDSAVKTNIQPLESSLEVIKQMKPVTFEYKPFYSKDSSIQTGFIAQDLQQLLADKIYKNGVVKEGGQYLGVAYETIIPLLVKAIQEQQQQIDELKAQLIKK